MSIQVSSGLGNFCFTCKNEPGLITVEHNDKQIERHSLFFFSSSRPRRISVKQIIAREWLIAVILYWQVFWCPRRSLFIGGLEL